MYEVLIWSDADGDFIQYRLNGKTIHVSYDEACNIAYSLQANGQQAKVQYVRNLKRPRKTMRSGRIQRIPTTIWAGERVKVIAVVNSQGRKVK